MKIIITVFLVFLITATSLWYRNQDIRRHGRALKWYSYFLDVIFLFFILAFVIAVIAGIIMLLII